MAEKTWGPFTGAQLTIMFVAAMAVILPGTLWAVTASSVSITDIANGHTAAISSARRLFVTALMEGTPTPATFFHSPYASGIGCLVLAAAPSGKALIVTKVRIGVFQNGSPGPTQAVSIYAGTGCSAPLSDVFPPSIGQFDVPFEPGVATKTGISARIGGSLGAVLYADGYLVPAAQVP